MQTLKLHPPSARIRALSAVTLILTVALPQMAHATRRRPIPARAAPSDGAVNLDKGAPAQRTRRVADKAKKRKVRKKRAPKVRKKRARRTQKRRTTTRRPAARPHAPRSTKADLLEGHVAPQRLAVVQTALALEGAPYAYASKGPTRFDCSGFTHFVLKQHGVTVTGSSRHQALQGRAIPWRNAQPGDLVFFRRKGQIRHVGLVVKNEAGAFWVAHATNRGVVVDDVLASRYWRPQLSEARTVL